MDTSNTSIQDVIEVKLSHFVGAAYIGDRIDTWCFSARTQHRYFSTSTLTEEMNTLFRVGGCHDYAFGAAMAYDTPFLMSDKIGLIWLGEYAVISEGSRMLVLMGPMFYTSTSPRFITSLLQRMVESGEIEAKDTAAYRSLLRSVPVVSTQTVNSYARMLHFNITGETLAQSQIHYQTEAAPEGTAEDGHQSSWADYSYVQSQEQLFLQCVREGNLNYMEVLDSLNYSVMERPLSADPVRSEVYKVVTNAALCSRAAIEGGLSPAVALSLEEKYIGQADRLTRVTDLRELNIRLLSSLVPFLFYLVIVILMRFVRLDEKLKEAA